MNGMADRANLSPFPVETVRRGAIALLASWLVNWSVLVVVRELALVSPFDHLHFVPVTIWTTVGVLGATIVYGLIDRSVDQPDRQFLWVASVVLVVSFVPTIGLLIVDPEATLGAVTVLALMHVIVAVSCVSALTTYGPGD